MPKKYGDEYGCIPCKDAGGITKVFSWPSHKGLDIGWADTPYCRIMAWQDGKVVARGYGSEVGNYIVMEHSYVDGTKRWTGYIHLAYTPNVAVGHSFNMFQQMGNATRGNTGQSRGTHLHLYLTKKVDKSVPYTWNNMLTYSIDPYPHLGYLKGQYSYISSEWKRELKEMKYPVPVARNEKVNQCDIRSETRNMRNGASLTAGKYDAYCVKGIYNVKDMKNADGYLWGLIDVIDGNQFWVAIMDGEFLAKSPDVIYPQPVARNEAVAQIDIKSETRRLRSSASSKDDKNVYDELCKKGIYNVVKQATADGYDWAMIGKDVNGHEFWVAVMAGEDLPVTDYKTLYEKQVAINGELRADIAKANAETKAAKADFQNAKEKLEKIVEIANK